jgi:putative membrane protein
MQDLLAAAYLWIKAVHVMAVIAWMAGLFYLPRLFVYHVEGLNRAGVVRDSDMDLLFQHQERLLLRVIMNPAMLAAWLSGLALAAVPGVVDWSMAWAWVKAAGVLAMTAFHHWLAVERRRLAAGTARLTGRGYRIVNELPTVLMIGIVLAVILRF